MEKSFNNLLRINAFILKKENIAEFRVHRGAGRVNMGKRDKITKLHERT
jgi:hypothetical protein